MTDVEVEFPSASNIFCGQLAPRVPTEVGCESLFSSSGYANNPRRVRMDIRMYERLIIGKHRMNRLYISTQNVKQRYMERFKKNSWDEDKEHDSREYLDEEEMIWAAEYPLMAEKMFKEEEDDMGLDDMSSKEEQNGENDGDNSCSGSERDNEDANLDSSNESNGDAGSSPESPGIYNLAGDFSSPLV